MALLAQIQGRALVGSGNGNERREGGAAVVAELALTWLAAGGYALALVAAVARGGAWRGVPVVLAAALAAHTAGLAVRWAGLGHGPFTTLYEILSSNVWSLALVFGLAYWRVPAVRPAATLALAVLMVMTAWLLAADPAPGHFPPTYATPLLYVHVSLGKVFLGLLLTAAALSGAILLRRTGWGRFPAMPEERRLGELAYRFAAAAFVFETLMLIAGAVWAQDAWGRYWAWDPLETWSFLTWLALAFALHRRAAGGPRPGLEAGLLIAVFVLAFLTFFGVPFVSTAPHKGAF